MYEDFFRQEKKHKSFIVDLKKELYYLLLRMNLVKSLLSNY